MAMKRDAPQYGGDDDWSAKRPHHGGKGGGGGAAMCLKLLISPKEASTILGPGGATSREISQQMGVKLHLSNRFQFYPGTNLQELTVKGQDLESVGNAVLQVFGKLAEETGCIACGEDNVEESGVRLKFLLPVAAAKAVIGKGGDNIRNLRRNTGFHIHIEEVAVGAGDTAEQMVTFKGNIMGVEAALTDIMEKVSAFSGEAGFQTWLSTSHAQSGTSTATQIAPVKGGGKSYGKGGGKCGGKGKAMGMALAPMAGKGGYNSWSAPPQEAYGGGGYGGGASDDNGWAPQEQVHFPAVQEEQPQGEVPEGLDIIAGAVQSLPASMQDPSDRSQKICFNIPIDFVSPIIGKGGSGVKEISAATQAKIQIREIEGNPAEKTIMVHGGATGVAAAYLYLAGRIGTLQEMTANGMYQTQEAEAFQD